MKFSQKFGKRIADNRIQRALLVEGKTDEEYLSEGWKRLDMAWPKKEEGYFWKFGPFKEDEDGTIRPSWTKVKLPEQTKTYSKLKVMLALTKLGIWRGVREWLDQTFLDGTHTRLGELFDAAQVFKSNDPNFKPVFADVKAKFGISDSDAAEILKGCEAD